MQEDNFVVSGVDVSAFFLDCFAQLCSVESSSIGLVPFEVLIIYTKLIPPNTQCEFFSMNIRFGCWTHGHVISMIFSFRLP